MTHFIVHDERDSVGVVVVEGVRKGQELDGWVMEQDRQVRVRASEDIPMGHKLAIRPMDDGGAVIKYGVVIGRAIAPIGVGEHVHVHNVKTRRW